MLVLEQPAIRASLYFENWDIDLVQNAVPGRAGIVFLARRGVAPDTGHSRDADPPAWQRSVTLKT